MDNTINTINKNMGKLFNIMELHLNFEYFLLMCWGLYVPTYMC